MDTEKIDQEITEAIAKFPWAKHDLAIDNGILILKVFGNVGGVELSQTYMDFVKVIEAIPGDICTILGGKAFAMARSIERVSYAEV